MTRPASVPVAGALEVALAPHAVNTNDIAAATENITRKIVVPEGMRVCA